MSQQAERRVGTIIGGKWRVDALLGSGSMAAVYAVTHRNGARAALKILHPTLCTDPAVCERFLGEGYLANSVKHSGIVRVLDDGVTDDGCVFLTMDLLEGDTLEAFRQKRGMKIPVVEALDLADKLMDVLSAVHTAGIIHRDLKPQNVFVCDDGVVKLLDFGVARVFDRTSQSKLSMFGLVLGTPSFMSPEQALGSRDKVDHRSDIWSFGATLFTALTGETVHLGANVQAKLLAAATVKARSIAMVMPDLPPGVAAAIDMALRFKKEDRWQTVDAMRRAFREARDNAGLGRPVEPVRAFDMSLDESTHVDKGGPSGLPTSPSPPARSFDGERTQRLDSEPPEGPSGTFIGVGDRDGKISSVVGNDGSVPPPPAFITNLSSHASHPSGRPPAPGNPSTRPSGFPPASPASPSSAQSAQSSPPRGKAPSNAAPMQAGPAATAPPPGPIRARMPSMPAPSGPMHGRDAGNLPFLNAVPSSPNPQLGVPVGPSPSLRRPTPDPGNGIRSSRPDGQEGSIPAYGNTLNFGADDSVSDIDPRELGMRRKSSVAVWLMAVLLAAAALGGIAFFAVKRGPEGTNGVGPDPRTPATPSTSATVPSVVPTPGLPSTAVTPPGSIEISSPPVPVPAKDAAAATPTPPAATPTPPVRVSGFPARPPGGGGHAPRTPRPAAPPTNTAPPDQPTSEPRPTPPGLAPDPFGTPE